MSARGLNDELDDDSAVEISVVSMHDARGNSNALKKRVRVKKLDDANYSFDNDLPIQGARYGTEKKRDLGDLE